jgi:hypothetical protein
MRWRIIGDDADTARYDSIQHWVSGGGLPIPPSLRNRADEVIP